MLSPLSSSMSSVRVSWAPSQSLATICASANAAIYDAWSASYDRDIREWGYEAPERATQVLAQLVPEGRGRVLDAGCGSGLQARSLADAGFGPLEGCDVSRELLKRAEATGLYESLRVADLNVRLPYDDNAFDAVVCVGTLTYIDPQCNVLREFARIVVSGGVVLVTSRTDLKDAWEDEARAMASEGVWREVARQGPTPYLPGHPDYAGELALMLYAWQVR